MAVEPYGPVTIEEEVEGDRDGTSDFVFCRIGSAVPLKRSGSSFDLLKAPTRPLVVSEKSGLLFLAYPGGFLMARTSDVVKLAKDTREVQEGSRNKTDMEGLCIQDLAILDAHIDGVNILALSTDSSVLAVVVAEEVRFFSVPNLINKDQAPIFTRSADDHVKDFLWRKSVGSSFVMLSTSGTLYHGDLENDLKNIMGGVDAADWSVEGNFLAVARSNMISILSSELKQQLDMSLLFHPWTSDAELKVDSLKWVCSDSIVIGCAQVNENDEEFDYMVQVITAKQLATPEACSKPVVISFNDLFPGIVDDIVPSGSGPPQLLMSYLENWDIGIVANRKNTDEHVVLLAWLANDEGKTPVALEFEQENFIPRIELQENHDENLLLGIDVDRNCIHDKLELKIDSEVKVLSPWCILLGLSCEGKLILFHIARISEPVSSCTYSKTTGGVTDDKNTSVVLPLAGGPTLSGTAATGEQLQNLENLQLSEVKEQASALSDYDKNTEHNQKILQLPQSSFMQGISSLSRSSMKTGGQPFTFNFSGVSASTLSSAGSMLSGSTISNLSKLSSKNGEARPVATRVDSLQVSGVQFVRKPEASNDNTIKSSLISSGGPFPGPGDSKKLMGDQMHSISQSSKTSIQTSVSFSKETSSIGSKTSSRSNHNQSVLATSPAPLKEKSNAGKHLAPNLQCVHSGNKARGSPGFQESEPKLSKQFYSVKDMTEELDSLLAYLEQEGGFVDACTVAHRSMILSLEGAVRTLSERFRMCKVKMEEQLRRIQQLQDKRLHFSARQIYIEGLLVQASNDQYWDIWDRRKLGPEFEVKQQQISKLNNDLLNELVDLEIFFNAFELKKYSETGEAPKGRRALLGSLESSRQISSLYNTVNSQLAAAEQLSECLSKQMATLNINSPPPKCQSIRKELFKSIGLEYYSDSYQSPEPKRISYASDSSYKSASSLSSRAVNEQTRRNAVGVLKTSEPGSSRRRRYSLDRSWTRFDPPKTTVKRILIEEREEHIKIGTGKTIISEKKAATGPSSRGHIGSNMSQESIPSLRPSMSMFQSQLDKLNEDNQKELSQKLSESQKNSLFKWTRDLSQDPKDVGPVCSMGSHVQSSIPSTQMTTPSSLSNNVVNKQQEFGVLSYKPRFGFFTEKQHNSSSEDDLFPKSRFDSQLGVPASNQPFSVASSVASPSKYRSSIRAFESSEKLNMKRGGEEPGSSRGTTEKEVANEHPFSIPEKIHSSISPNIIGSNSNIQRITITSQSCGASSSNGSFISSLPHAAQHSSVAAPPIPLTIPSESPAVAASTGEPSATVLSHVSSSQTSLQAATPVDSCQFLANPFTQQISKTSAAQSLPLTPVSSSSSFVTSQVSVIAVKPVDPVAVVSETQPTIPTKGEASTESAIKRSSLLSDAVNQASSSSLSLFGIPSFTSTLPSVPTKVKDENLDIVTAEEDEMEEEAPELNTALNLGAFGGFGLGQSSATSAPNTDIFGLVNSNSASQTSAAFSFTVPHGELFRPASFSLPSSQPLQSNSPMNPGGFSSGFSGFGQPAQIGAGQQALGSVLGAFGQSRQLGVGAQASGTPSSDGFLGGDFQAAATSGGRGFPAATAAGGGFAGFGSGTGGFAAMASKPGSFAAAASAGSGFSFGASSGGFTSGAFGSFATNQGAGVFSQFGGTTTTGAGKPPAELLMNMRK